MKFCGECGTPITANPSGPPAPSYAEITSALNETLAQQTATSEILLVISSSPTDAQPVFDAILQSAVRLCDGLFGAAYRFDGAQIHVMAHHHETPEALEILNRAFPASADDTSMVGRAIRTRAIVHIPDTEAEGVPPTTAELARKLGFRSAVSVPMLREGRAIGALALSRRERRPFSQKEIALLQTFADQAVIAIENVRLFTELQNKHRALTAAHAEISEALEQQTATSEVLRIISRSTFDLQPVLNTLIESATRLCGGDKGFIFRRDGEVYRGVADYGTTPQHRDYIHRTPVALGRDTVVGRVALERRTLHFPDILADSEYRWAEAQRIARFRTVLGVPMLREGAPIGVFFIWREEVRPYTDKQIELVTTFADQAVIAIENVRLFTELQEKNRALTEAHGQVTESLEQQTATAEILRVIASSPIDVRPVFDAIAEAAMRLCGAASSLVTTFDGELLHLSAQAAIGIEGRDAVRSVYPRPPAGGFASGRAILTRAIVHIPDVTVDREYDVGIVARVRDFRSILAVPMLREGRPIGTINVHGAEPGLFTDNQITLLQTFADQAVIAIENVRLFNETKEALEQQTATSDILRVIASSPTDVQPVFDAIAERAMYLCGASSGAVTRFDRELVHVAALANVDPEEVGAIRSVFPMPPSHRSAAARAVLTHSIVHIPDVRDDPEYGIAT
jgi:GAF domain-containing protein